MNIRVLEESDARAYQELQLRALKGNPEAFGSTYEREEKFTLETIVERIKPTGYKFVLGAFDASEVLAGIVTFVRASGPKEAHKGNVFGMYVSPDARGQGLGKALMLELIGKARAFDGLEQINLAVMSENNAAIKLYKSLGFKVYGVERNALKYNGQYDDEDFMVLKV